MGLKQISPYLKQPGRQRQRKRHYKVKSCCFKFASLLFSHFIQFVKRWGISLELIQFKDCVFKLKKKSSWVHVPNKTWNKDVLSCTLAKKATKFTTKKAWCSCEVVFCWSKAPLIWGKVVPGKRVIIPAESNLAKVYEKNTDSLACDFVKEQLVLT